MSWYNPSWWNWGSAGAGAGTGAGVGSFAGPWGAGIGAGVGGLLGGLFGGGKEATPPDINAPQYQYQGNIDEWLNTGRSAIRESTNEWMKNALRQVDATAAERGLLNTSYRQEIGREVAGKGAQMYSQALADLEGKAEAMRFGGWQSGMERYGQDYNTYLQQAYADQDEWISSVLAMAPLMGQGFESYYKRQG